MMYWAVMGDALRSKDRPLGLVLVSAGTQSELISYECLFLFVLI